MGRTHTQLEDQVFAFSETKSGMVLISHRGKTVKTLKGKDATRFMNRVAHCDTTQGQLLMAKLTGQFKFGNERAVKDAAKH